MIQHTKLVLENLLGPKDRQDLALADGLPLLCGSADCLSPDVPEISITASGPLGRAWIFDTQARIQRHAMWGRVRAVDWGFALVSHR